MRYIFSPEFHRNLWLRFSPLRLLAAPLTLALCIVASANMPSEGDNSLGPDWMRTLMNSALCIYFIVVIVWGVYEAATALQEEVRGNTWDFQRMSSMSPQKLVLGKLFGATSYTWYFGLLALGVYGYAYHHFQTPTDAMADVARGLLPPGAGGVASPKLPAPEDDTLFVMLYLVLAGFIGQALAFLHSLVDMTAFPSGTGKLRLPRGIGAFLIGSVVAAWAAGLALSGAIHLKPVEDALFFRHSFRHWYGMDFDREIFDTCSLLFYLFWFLVGSYRLARAELMYRCTPVVWMLFVAGHIAWCGGFAATPGDENSYAIALALGFMQAAVGFCYGAMLVEASDGRKYARFAFYLRALDFRQAFENMPKWIATLPIVAALYIAALVYAPEPGHGYRLDSVHLAFLMSSGLLFMARDGCAVHSIYQAIRGRGAGFATLFYYVLAYGLLPLAAFKPLNVDIDQAILSMRMMGVETPPDIARAIGFFYPNAFTDPVVSLLPAAAELAAAALCLAALVRRNSRRKAAEDGVKTS